MSQKAKNPLTQSRSTNPSLPGLAKSRRAPKRRRDGTKKSLVVDMADLIDPQVTAWSHQMHHLFDRTAPDMVAMPVYEDSFPCPSTLDSNYGSQLIVPIGNQTGAYVWLTPNGVYENFEDALGTNKGSDGKYNSTTVTFASGVKARLGPTLRSADNRSAAGCIQVGDDLAISQLGTHCLIPTTTNPLLWDDLEAPFLSGFPGVTQPGTNTGLKFRTSAFAVRVSFVTALFGTEGWVEQVQPYEVPDLNADFSALRKGPDYRRKFFGEDRSYVFIYVPTCDDIPFALDKTDSTVDTVFLTRFNLRIGGLKAGDQVLVEYISVQEWVGDKAIPTNSVRLQSPDATHLVNAMVSGGADVNPLDGFKPNPGNDKALAKIATGHKVRSHPWYHKHALDILSRVGDLDEVARAVRLGTDFARRISEGLGKNFLLGAM